MNNTTKNILCLLLSICLVACTGRVPVTSTHPKDLRAQLQAGDTVRVQLSSGQAVELVLVKITDKEIVGEKARVALADVQSLSAEKRSTGKSTAMVAGIAAGVVVLGIVILRGIFAAGGDPSQGD